MKGNLSVNHIYKIYLISITEAVITLSGNIKREYIRIFAFMLDSNEREEGKRSTNPG